MLGAVDCMFNIVTDYSTNHGDFATVKDKCNQTIKKAQTKLMIFLCKMQIL